MSISTNTGRLFEAVQTRHRTLLLAGVGSTTFGLVLAAYVGYRWFVHGVSHEVLALLAAAAVLVGVQLLVLSALTSMLIALHREVIHKTDQPD